MKKLSILFALLVTMMAAGCSDEPENTAASGNIEMDGDVRVTVLHLSAGEGISWETVTDAEFKIVDPVKRHTFVFGGNVRHDGDMRVLGSVGAAICRIAIGSIDIPDGDYYISVTGSGLPELGPRLVKFVNNVGSEQQDNPIDYEDLSGEGTSQNPYLINDAGDFLSFLYYLQDDPSHACGRYFRQTASFDLPHRSVMIDGRVWLPVTFSGHYDGGGFDLHALTYQGASDQSVDSGIGLFKELYSATVENVKLTDAVILHAHSNVGLVAGSASGSSVLDNISLSGTISASGDNIGGLIGVNNGSCTISNIQIKTLSVSGDNDKGQNIGAIVGAAKGDAIKVTGVSTSDHIFSVTGFSHVGGIVGNVDVKSASFDNITLEHSVDQESSAVKVIYSSSMYVGGIVGFISATDNMAFSRVAMKCPVRGVGDVGGLSGHAVVSRTATIENTVMSSVVSGEANSIGGFFGYLNLGNSDASLTFLGADNTTRYIVKSSEAASVEGNDYVGGIVGYLEGNRGKIMCNGKVEIAVNIKGRYDVGGAFGRLKYLGSIDVSGFNFSSITMRVSGDQNVGGIIGRSYDSTITGPNKYDLYTGIPTADKLQSCYGSVVEGNTNVGGIGGLYQGNITGVASDATVTATVNCAGGICGYFEGTIDQCAFFGNVACPKIVSGIMAGSNNYLKATSCLNLADIDGGEYQGGVLGYVDSSPYYMALSVDKCFNKGKLANGLSVGGVIGYIREPYIAPKYIYVTNCGNSGEISATGNDNRAVGGVAGFLPFNVKLEHCANHGSVWSRSAKYNGGVVGEIGIDSSYKNYIYVTQCMNSGKVSGDYNSHCGGIVGIIHSGYFVDAVTMTAQIYDCYNTGNISPDTHDDTGGILGYATYHTDTFRNFNRGDINDGNAIIGTHTSGSVFSHSDNYFLEGKGKDWPSSKEVSKKDVGNKSVYHNFNFNTIWDITSDGPVLRDCPFQYIK